MVITSMAICNKVTSNPPSLTNSIKENNISHHSVMRANYGTDNIVANNNKSNKIKNSINPLSPYLSGDKIQMISQVTDKRVVHRKATDIVSSFPLAVKIYKASSDEFKLLKKGNKKMRKSVLTLPNEQTSMTQACTVSDINDSEYYNRENEERKTKIKKRLPITSKRKTPRRQNFEYYDRDSKYLSRFNIDLDCSSSNIFKHFDGDSKLHKTKPSMSTAQDMKGHDVWAVLRNINRFQFMTSPPMSEDSFVTPNKKKGGYKNRSRNKGARYLKTSHTEEYAYISSIEVGSKSTHTFSQSSSFDRVTVINKENEFSKTNVDCKNILDGQNFDKLTKSSRNSNEIKTSNKRLPRSRIYRSKERNQLENHKISNENKQSGEVVTIHESFMPKSSNTSQEKKSKSRTITDTFSEDKSSDSNIEKEVFETIGDLENTGELSRLDKSSIPCVKKVNARALASDESAKELKGISRVILSKGQNIALAKQMEMQKKISPLPTETTKAKFIPKPNFKDEIKPEVTKLPLEILKNNDVNTYEAPQFQGLDKQIWPFMIDWYKNDGDETSICKEKSKYKDSYAVKININAKDKSRKVNNEISINKNITVKERNQSLNIDSIVNEKIHDQRQFIKKLKPMSQIKDKMLKFLYKKSSSHSLISCSQTGVHTGFNEKKHNISNTVDKSTTTTAFIIKNKPASSKKCVAKTSTVCNRKPQEATSNHTWAKAKWASDFIDNVIKKIKNGVYYIYENKNLKDGLRNKKPSIILKQSKEASVQTVLSTKNNYTCCDEEVQSKRLVNSIAVDISDPLRILGFDASLPDLEIEAFNKNKIAVKHCVTNVTVQFDVTDLDQFDGEIKNRKSSTLIPIESGNGTERFFKCKTTILNAMLPAELCSIIPKMIKNLNMTKTNEICEHKLFTITELSYSENLTPNKIISIQYNTLSPNIKYLLNGRFREAPLRLGGTTIARKSVWNITHCHSDFVLLPNLENSLILHTIFMHKIDSLPIQRSMPKRLRRRQLDIYPIGEESKTRLSTAVEVYCESKQITHSRQYELNLPDAVVNNFKNNTNLLTSLSFRFLCCNYDNNGNLSLGLNVTNQGFNCPVIVTITKFPFNSLYGNQTDSFNEKKIGNYNAKSIEYCGIQLKRFNLSTNSKPMKMLSKSKKPLKVLYRKCKSTTTLTKERSKLLNKIVTIEDFCGILGSKSLASVFDDNAATKIMASIIEMKNWIPVLNERQAVLVLLLSNKYDTPNLVRFRPILLQGIAVNRITRVTELDTEIAVIERENMNKLSKFEGISYLPASPENKNNLLEELSWIAKTTASDYQRTFDGSSESLLKSLLEKRKKLNPSYLRVMARYVGLGLLRLPVRN